MQGLEWDEVEGESYSILRLRGNIALYNSGFLEKRVDELYRRGVSLLMNIKNVTYFDSRGMGFFLDMYKKFEELPDAHFCLISIPAARLQHFKISGLLGVIKVFDDEAQALTGLGFD